MVGGISFGGLGSGLDTGAIIDALLELESRPLQLLEAKKELEQEKLDLLGTLKGHVQALRDKAEDLSTMSGFLHFQVQASLEGYASFSVSSGASAGAHTLRVDSLATADRWAFDPVADPDVPLATADGQGVSFTYLGTTYDVDVAQADSSLNGIAAAIREATDGAVSVSVVNTGTESAPTWQMVIAGSETGAEARITGISSSVAGLTIDGTPPDPGGNPQSLNNITVGMNAVAWIDGLQVTRSDNDFSGVVEGVGITVTKADPDTTISFTVDPDKEAIKTGVQEFVDLYNAVIDFINGQSEYSEEEGASGELFGDPALRSVRNTLVKSLFGQTLAQVQGDLEGYGTLTLLGIESSVDGRLSIDDAQFDEKLDGNLEAFAELFVDSDGFDNGGALPGTPEFYVDLTPDSGLADDLMRAIDTLVERYDDGQGKTYKGLFDARSESVNAKIKLYDKQIEQQEYRLERVEAQLVARFTALETLMAELNAQGAYLQQELTKL
jgi:flagellar hook-associated protein 2